MGLFLSSPENSKQSPSNLRVIRNSHTINNVTQDSAKLAKPHNIFPNSEIFVSKCVGPARVI